MNPQLEATLNATVIRAVNLAAQVKIFSAIKKDALEKCSVADLAAPGLPEGYQYRIERKVRKTMTYKPEDMEPGEAYAMVRTDKAFGIAGIPEIIGEPWEVYEFASLCESNAEIAKDANAKRLRDAMQEAGVERWVVEGYGTATLCAGKPKAKQGAVPVAVKETFYQYPELLTPYKREEARAHAEFSAE